MNVWELLAKYNLQEHRKEQERIANEVENGVAQQYRHLKFEDLDGSQLNWVDRTLPAVREGFESSQSAAAAFLLRYRGIAIASQTGSVPPARPTYVPVSRAVQGRISTRLGQHFLAPGFNEPNVAASLLAAGPGTVKRSMPAPSKVVMGKALRNVVGTAVRHSMDGGREVVATEVDNDDLAIGFQRITDKDPCYFCALLAANGPVYLSRSSFDEANNKFDPNAAFAATGEPDAIAKVHNHCRCTIVPVFEGFEGVDPWGKVALSIWRTVRGKWSGQEAMNKYRLLYDDYKSSDPNVDSDISAQAVRESIATALRNLQADDNAPDDSAVGFLQAQARRLRAA